MSTWSDLGFPCIHAGGYGYGLDLGIARPAVDSAIPDQKVTWVEPLKTFNVSCVLSPEMLSEIEAFFAVDAYTWFTMPLVSGDGAVDHTVRAVGPYSLTYQSPTVWSLQFQVETPVEPVCEALLVHDLTISYRHTLQSLGTRLYFPGDTLECRSGGYDPVTAEGTAAVASDPSEIIDGSMYQCVDASGVLSRADTVGTVLNGHDALGFRFLLEDVDTSVRLAHLGAVGGSSYETTGGVTFHYNTGSWYLRSTVAPVTGSSKWRTARCLNVPIQAGVWYQLIIVNRGLAVGDWYMFLDGVRHDFEEYDIGTGSIPLPAVDYFGGAILDYYGSRGVPVRVDDLFVVTDWRWGEFGGIFPQQYATLLQAAIGDQVTSPPDNNKAQTIFDVNRSGPQALLSFPQPNQLTPLGDKRTWTTGVTVRGIPHNETRLVALRFNCVENFDAQSLIYGICGDTPWNNQCDSYIGDFGNHLGLLLPSLGLWLDDDTAAHRMFRGDYTASVTEGLAVSPADGEPTEVILDRSVGEVRFYTAAGLQLGAFSFDFENEYVRFAVSMSYPLGLDKGRPVVELIGTGFTPHEEGAIPFDDLCLFS